MGGYLLYYYSHCSCLAPNHIRQKEVLFPNKNMAPKLEHVISTPFYLLLIHKTGAGNAGRPGTFLISRFGRRSDPAMRVKESRRLFKAAKEHSGKTYHSGHDDKFLSSQYYGLSSSPKSQWNDNASLQRRIRNPKWF